MSGYMKYEAALFLLSVGMGAGLCLIYQFVAAFRSAFPCHSVLLDIFDVIYWVAAGIFSFCIIYRFNQGILRNFLLLGNFMGVWLCCILVASPLRKLIRKVIKIIAFFCRKCREKVAIFARRM